VDKPQKDALLENLAVASVLALMALIVATLSFVVERGEIESERSSIAALAGAGPSASSMADAAMVAKPLSASDSAFRHIYALQKSGQKVYGAVLSLGSLRRATRVAALVGSSGELLGARFLDSGSAGLPYAEDGWFSDFLGKGGDKPYPSSRLEARVPDAVSGSTESFLDTAKALGRLSAFVRSHGREE
jgi:hypothetical protein